MFLTMQTRGPCGLHVLRAATPRSGVRAGRKQEPEQPGGGRPPRLPASPSQALGSGAGLGPTRPPPDLSLLQRSPRSAVTYVTSSSSPSWTCGATRSTRAVPWGPPCTRAWARSSSPRAWAAATGRPTSARTVSACSPASTGAAPPPACRGQQGGGLRGPAGSPCP